MFKQHVLKLVVGVAVVLTLLGGGLSGSGASAARMRQALRPLACGTASQPPCW